MTKVDIKELTPTQLVEFLGGLGKEKFRAGQILRWV
ncbi:MAG: 23S rRNA (adenine(2503)-C(2))-methyltransferase RlmN, partial [Desulfuromonas sp.]